ncbi:hypothetical protein A0130_06620 [Leifsonia xyli]|uniref:hypothetical protein n=1 Tax=Leifsonia xyli TaxID=1575 RepID=UPI0007CDDB48|nr:hypothetical protein A0130_06620 [Leifsonia xyli]
MNSTTRIRYGAITAAAAILAGGFLATAPANAANTGSITLANTTFTEGDWGTGLDVTGTGFTAGSIVTITVGSATTTIDTHPVAAPVLADGSFHETWTPTASLPLPATGETISVTATTDAGDTTTTPVDLTVNAAVALPPKSISTSVSTITTADLADRNIGFDLYAAGYTPGETLNFTAAFDGQDFDSFTETAAADGSTDIHLWMTGVVESGTLTITVAGATSGVSQSVSISVTGDTIITEDGGLPAISTAAPAAAPTATRLPVVSG